MTLFIKYKPKNIKEYIGQKKTIKALIKFKKEKKIPINYIISGPGGSGKTTLGNIYYKLINCKNKTICGKCKHCKKIKNCKINPDYIEFDAATNRSVKDINNIFKKNTITAINGKYKTICIDEAQLLSEKAVKYLLKILENKRKNNTIIILITTNLNKIPETIKSRCIILKLRLYSLYEIIKIIKIICKKEKINISKKSIITISKNSKGNIRNGLNIIELIKYKNKKIRNKETLKTINPTTNIEKSLILTIIYKKKNINTIINYIYIYNINIKKIIKNIIQLIKHIIYQKKKIYRINEINIENKLYKILKKQTKILTKIHKTITKEYKKINNKKYNNHNILTKIIKKTINDKKNQNTNKNI